MRDCLFEVDGWKMRLNATGSQLPEREGETPVPAVTRWRVSDLLLDTRRQRVWRDSREIPLPKLTYDLLATLARCHPTVFSDEEVMVAVWPGLVVSQETLSQRVKLLRDALGDDARNPRYIGRLRSRGYHLVGTVQPLPDVDESPPPADTPEVDAPITIQEDLVLFEPEWPNIDCHRPEWAVTQVVDKVTAEIFAKLVAPCAADALVAPRAPAVAESPSHTMGIAGVDFP